MGGIVIELQREALDEKNSIESLIRKAYLVAKNLKNGLIKSKMATKRRFQNIEILREK